MAKAMAAMAQLDEQAVSLLEVQEIQVHVRHAYGQVDASVSQIEGQVVANESRWGLCHLKHRGDVARRWPAGMNFREALWWT